MYELDAYGDAPITCRHRQVTLCGDTRLDVLAKLGDDNNDISIMAKRALIGFDLFECNAMKTYPVGTSVEGDLNSSEIIFPTIIHMEQSPGCDVSDDSVTRILKRWHTLVVAANNN
jgi:hypothetical protein